jgi:hypothetical protein
MAYIGTKPTIGNFQICDAISVVNGQAAYTMQVGWSKCITTICFTHDCIFKWYNPKTKQFFYS